MSLEEQIGGLTVAIEKLAASLAQNSMVASASATCTGSGQSTQESVAVTEPVKKGRGPNKSKVEKPLSEKTNEDLMEEALVEEELETENSDDDNNLPDLHPNEPKDQAYYDKYVKAAVTAAVVAGLREKLMSKDGVSGVFNEFEYVNSKGESVVGFKKADELPGKYWGRLILAIQELMPTKDDLA